MAQSIPSLTTRIPTPTNAKVLTRREEERIALRTERRQSRVQLKRVAANPPEALTKPKDPPIRDDEESYTSPPAEEIGLFAAKPENLPNTVWQDQDQG